MSIDTFDAEPSDVWTETTRRARKEHACSACRETIRRGDLYVRHVCIFERRPSVALRCLRCDVMYHALDKKIQQHSDGDAAADWRLECGHEYQDRWGEEPPEDLARLAFMTAAEQQAEFGRLYTLERGLGR